MSLRNSGKANLAISIGKGSQSQVLSPDPPGENNLQLQLVILLIQLMGVCNNLKLFVGGSHVHLLQELKV